MAVAEILPRRLTFRAMADVIREEYPDITPVAHGTISRDVNIILSRFKAETKQIAGRALLADLEVLDEDERLINDVVAALLGDILPEHGSPDKYAIDRFVKLLGRKGKILEHRAKLLGFDTLAEDSREGANAGSLRLTEQERIDQVVELLDRARARRDVEDVAQLSN
jgi:hypothetical protein